MPYLHAKTNGVITKEQEIRLKERFGEAIALLGKTENWLMVEMEDQCRLHFKGDGDIPAAFVEIRLFGKASASAYDAMTEAVTNIVEEELKIPGDRIYVQYEEVEHWGYDGSNF